MATQETVVQRDTVAKLQKFVREVRAELKKVSWPDKQELISYTGVVFVTVLVVAALIAGIDWIYGELLRHIIRM